MRKKTENLNPSSYQSFSFPYFPGPTLHSKKCHVFFSHCPSVPNISHQPFSKISFPLFPWLTDPYKTLSFIHTSPLFSGKCHFLSYTNHFLSFAPLLFSGPVLWWLLPSQPKEKLLCALFLRLKWRHVNAFWSEEQHYGIIQQLSSYLLPSSQLCNRQMTLVSDFTVSKGQAYITNFCWHWYTGKVHKEMWSLTDIAVLAEAPNVYTSKTVLFSW